jgi:hypothetical protein
MSEEFNLVLGAAITTLKACYRNEVRFDEGYFVSKQEFLEWIENYQ